MTDGKPPVVWAIVVAAGSGSRFGRLKQYEVLGDRRVLDWSLAAARSVSAGVVLAVGPDMAGRPEPGADVVVVGGVTRSDSVRAALAAVPGGATVIVVHDAARPLADPSLFASVVAALGLGVAAAVPGLAPVDTVKRVIGDRVVSTLDRSELVTVQTPQAFRAEILRAVHAGPASAGDWATDDASLVERAGGVVVVVPGQVRNLKLTTPDDLDRLRDWAEHR